MVCLPVKMKSAVHAPYELFGWRPPTRKLSPEFRTSEAPVSEQNGSIGAECQRLGYNRPPSRCSRSMDIKNKVEADRHNDSLDPAGRAQLSHRVLKMKVHRILADL